MWFKKLLDNYKIHLIILFISTLLWFHVKTEKTYDQIVQVKVIPTNLNPEYIITNQYTQTVNVLIRGKGKSLIGLKNSTVEVQADLNQEIHFHQIVRLNLKNIIFSTTLLDVQPLEFVDKDTIHFELEAFAYKKVPVHSQISVTTQAGFIQIGDLSLRPVEITVSGPKNKIDGLYSITTQAVSLTNVNRNIDGTVSLINPFPADKVVLSAQNVEYSVEIQPLGERLIENIPIQILNKPAGSKIAVEPATLSLKIIGGMSTLKLVKKEAILAYIDYQRYRRNGEELLPATIKTPDNITFSEVYPQKFRLIIE